MRRDSAYITIIPYIVTHSSTAHREKQEMRTRVRREDLAPAMKAVTKTLEKSRGGVQFK